MLAELDDATANLTFWEGRVKREHHFWFIWLQQVGSREGGEGGG